MRRASLAYRDFALLIQLRLGCRYEQSLLEKQELEKTVMELRQVMNGAVGNASDKGNSDLQSLRQEFAEYRKRALNAVDQKDKELNSIQAHYREGGDDSSSAGRTNSFRETRARRISMESNSSLSGFDTPNIMKTNEYLKNIVYKYMSSSQHEVRASMQMWCSELTLMLPLGAYGAGKRAHGEGHCDYSKLHASRSRFYPGTL